MAKLTKEKAKRLIELRRKAGKPIPEGIQIEGLTDEQSARMVELFNRSVKAPAPEGPGTLETIGAVASRGMDVLGTPVRGAVSAALGQRTPEEVGQSTATGLKAAAATLFPQFMPGVKAVAPEFFEQSKQEILDPSTVQPGFGEILEKAGAPEMGRINLSPVEGETTGRDIIGFLGDVLSDPSTFFPAGPAVKAGSREAAKRALLAGERSASKSARRAGLGALDTLETGLLGPANLVKSPTALVRQQAQKTFENSLQEMVVLGTRRGKEDVAEVYRRYGIFGSPKRMREVTDVQIEFLKKETNKGIKEADRIIRESGQSVNPEPLLVELNQMLDRAIISGRLDRKVGPTLRKQLDEMFQSTRSAVKTFNDELSDLNAVVDRKELRGAINMVLDTPTKEAASRLSSFIVEKKGLSPELTFKEAFPDGIGKFKSITDFRDAVDAIKKSANESFNFTELVRLKRRMDEKVQDSIYNPDVFKSRAEAKQFLNFRERLKRFTMDQMNARQPGLGDEWARLNEDFGVLLSTSKAVTNTVNKATPALVTPGSAALGIAIPEFGVKFAAAQAGAKILSGRGLKSTVANTLLDLTSQERVLGVAPGSFFDSVIRRSLIKAGERDENGR